ncbi:MAG TPA: Imm52 family immunity protein [Motilibacteraceae bacterium]|nr:Imm52 family immunity protein [Motilibacteraceae bacterium]
MSELQPGDLSLFSAWGNRERTAAQIAADLLDMLRALEQIDPRLADWTTRTQRTLTLEAESLTRFVEGTHIPSPSGLGWQFSLASGGEDALDSVVLIVADGSTKDHPVNLGEVNVSAFGDWDGDSFFLAHADQLVDIVRRSWSPDWVSLTCSAYDQVQPNGRRVPRVGVLTWLADRLGAVPDPLPDGARISHPAGGTLIDLRPDPQTLPEVGAVAEVAGWLERAGVLRDIPQWQQQADSVS